jgi:DNA topoisomerase-3
VTALVNACDAGREGELIFRLIEQYAGGAKPLGKPVKRPVAAVHDAAGHPRRL